MYCDYAIMEAWLSFHDVTTVQNCGARALDYLEYMTYMAAIELSDLMKVPHPLIPKGNNNIDHNTTTSNY